MTRKLHLRADLYSRFANAVTNADPISGLTHNFYRYPARFSPEFAKQAVLAFSEPGDLVLDPFMGGGTTLVEALVAGRNVVGIDLSPLATFVSEVKTTPLGEKSLEKTLTWAEYVAKEAISHKKATSSF